MSLELKAWTFGFLLGAVLNLLPTVHGSERPLNSIESVSKSVVKIIATGDSDGDLHSIGSGTLISPNGFILTAKHTLTYADSLFVELQSGKRIPAQYSIVDAHRDLAVVKVNYLAVRNYQFADLDMLHKVRVGDEITAVGFSAGHLIKNHEPSVARGIVSGVNRHISHIPNRSDSEGDSSWKFEPRSSVSDLFRQVGLGSETLFQIDAMVNPGASGGPIINEDGKVVGVIKSSLTNTGSNVGMNFAIAVKDAETILRAAGIYYPTIETEGVVSYEHAESD